MVLYNHTREQYYSNQNQNDKTMINTIEIKKVGRTVKIIRDDKYIGMSIYRDGMGKLTTGVYKREIMNNNEHMIQDAMKMAEEIL